MLTADNEFVGVAKVSGIREAQHRFCRSLATDAGAGAGLPDDLKRMLQDERIALKLKGEGRCEAAPIVIMLRCSVIFTQSLCDCA